MRTRPALIAATMTVMASIAVVAPAAGAATPDLGVGRAHVCALSPTGTLQCWGSGASFGQLGTGSFADSNTPVNVTGLSGDPVALGVGFTHTCAVITGGSVQCWGKNWNGQLGASVGFFSASPVTVGSLGGKAVAVAPGQNHTCALLDDGSVKCWGRNDHGQLGDGTTDDSPTPVLVGLGGKASRLTSGNEFSCAVMTPTPTVKCWGRNDQGQLGDLASADSRGPVAVTGLTAGVAKMDSGGYHSCALLTNNTLACWGSNLAGQIGDGTGTDRRTATAVSGLGGTPAGVDAGQTHTCAVNTTGSVRCWGSGTGGELGNGTTDTSVTPQNVLSLASNAVSVAVGGYTSCAVLDTGAVQCWGSNEGGSLGNGTSVARSLTPVTVTGLNLSLPLPELLSTPAAATTSHSATFTFREPAGVTFTCSVDSGTPNPCTSPFSVDSLSEATHTFALRATYGSTETAPTTWTWKVDNTAPAKPFVATNPVIPSSGRIKVDYLTASFTFDIEAGATTECSRNGGASYTACPGSEIFFGMTDGPYSLKVRQVDAAGNTGLPTTVSWTVDLIAPATPVLTAAPAAFSKLKTATIAFAPAEAGAKVECGLDDEVPKPCTSPKALTALTEKSHTFTVAFTDVAGNRSSKSVSWLVDVTAPALLSKTKVKTSTQTKYTLGVAPDASGLAKVEYSTATKKPSSTATSVSSRTVAFASPTVFKTTATIRWIRLQDRAGNWSGWYTG